MPHSRREQFGQLGKQRMRYPYTCSYTPHTPMTTGCTYVATHHRVVTSNQRIRSYNIRRALSVNRPRCHAEELKPKRGNLFPFCLSDETDERIECRGSR